MKKVCLLGLTIIFGAAAACEEHSISEYQIFSKTVRRVEVSMDSSNVLVAASDDETSSVEYDVEYRGSEPSITTEVTDGTLKVRMRCRLSCDGDFVVKVPDNVTASLSVDSGNVKVEDLRGDASISVDSGNIHLNGLSGRLNLRADSGNISGDVDSTTVNADVDSGNVDIHFNQIPIDLEVTADSGNVTLEVPEGAYDIHTRVDSGEERIRSVTVDPDSPSNIVADVDSGNITIQGF